MSISASTMTTAFHAIQRAHRILVVPHANVDPDGISSALACFYMFRALGKEVTVICPDTLPDVLQFLPGFDALERDIDDQQDFVITIDLKEDMDIDTMRYTVEDNKVNIIVVPKKGSIRREQVSLSNGDQNYDLIVVVDTADLSLLGSLYTNHIDLFSKVPILNIDHHISNSSFGQIQMIDPTASSATEVLFSWFSRTPAFREHLNPDIATLLFTGLVTDTRSFQNPNTTPHALEIAAELLDLGARQQEIIQHIYKTKPLSTLRIWGRALNRLQIDRSARIVWSSVSRDDLTEMAASSEETHGILDELISTIPDAEVFVLFTELEDGGLKASVRSSAAVDVSALASEAFKGGGHPRAAGFRIRSFENFDLQVLHCIQKLKECLQRQREAPRQEFPVREYTEQMKSESGKDVLQILTDEKEE